jgi:hypothetical protein
MLTRTATEHTSTPRALLIDKDVTNQVRTVKILLLAIVIYVMNALWLVTHPVEPPQRHPPTRAAIQLQFFHKENPEGFSYTTALDSDRLNRLGNPDTLTIYEGTHVLGPANSSDEDISTKGMGRFSVKNWGLITLSASDNSDPGRNSREYWIAR